VPEGAANGSADISIGGSFRSERRITSPASGFVDRVPDRQTTSSGAMYLRQPYGLVLAAYPRNASQGGAGSYPHMVVDRCTWGDNTWIQGFDEALLDGAEAGNFSYSADMRTVSGLWAMNGTLAGNYTLIRTN